MCGLVVWLYTGVKLLLKQTLGIHFAVVGGLTHTGRGWDFVLPSGLSNFFVGSGPLAPLACWFGLVYLATCTNNNRTLSCLRYMAGMRFG